MLSISQVPENVFSTDDLLAYLKEKDIKLEGPVFAIRSAINFLEKELALVDTGTIELLLKNGEFREIKGREFPFGIPVLSRSEAIYGLYQEDLKLDYDIEDHNDDTDWTNTILLDINQDAIGFSTTTIYFSLFKEESDENKITNLGISMIGGSMYGRRHEHPMTYNGLGFHFYEYERNVDNNFFIEMENDKEYDDYEMDFMILFDQHPDEHSPIFYGVIKKKNAGENEEYYRVLSVTFKNEL